MARMWRWLAGLSGLGVTICIAAGLIFGAGTYTFHYAEGTSYLSNDPAACANCHVMNDYYAGWQKASHHHVATCNDCHVPHDLLRKYLLDEVQQVYRLQGVRTNDKHIEVIVRQMLRKVKIEDGPGDTPFLAHEEVDRLRFQEANSQTLPKGGRPAETEPIFQDPTKSAPRQ